MCGLTWFFLNQKWIIPRGLLPMGLISIQPWGWSSRISRLSEELLRRFHYRDLAWLSPRPDTGYGLDRSTPIVNDHFFELVRRGSADYVRGVVSDFGFLFLLFLFLGGGRFEYLDAPFNLGFFDLFFFFFGGGLVGLMLDDVGLIDDFLGWFRLLNLYRMG